MKQLTPSEIAFIKKTGWTPTVEQCDEWYRTIWTKEKLNLQSPNYRHEREALRARCYNLAYNTAKADYGVDLDELYKKCVYEYDGITLEYDATYLFYSFFTKEELEKLTDEEATKFLKDFKYFFGYRKWDGGNLTYVKEAIEAYDGERIFYLLPDSGEIWNTEKENSAYVAALNNQKPIPYPFKEEETDE